jgi:hypothetical protein
MIAGSLRAQPSPAPQTSPPPLTPAAELPQQLPSPPPLTEVLFKNLKARGIGFGDRTYTLSAESV